MRPNGFNLILYLVAVHDWHVEVQEDELKWRALMAENDFDNLFAVLCSD